MVVECRNKKVESIRIKDEEPDILSSEMLIGCDSTSAQLIDKLLEEGVVTFGSKCEVEELYSPKAEPLVVEPCPSAEEIEKEEEIEEDLEGHLLKVEIKVEGTQIDLQVKERDHGSDSFIQYMKPNEASIMHEVDS